MAEEDKSGATPPPEGTNPGSASGQPGTTSGNSNGGGSGATDQITLTAEQQRYVNQLIGAARTEGRTAGLTEAQREQQRQQQAAEADRLKAEQKYQELSERQAAELATLRQVSAEHQTLLSTIQAELTADLAALDPAIRALMPEGLTVAQQFSFVRKAQRTKPATEQTESTRGNATDPPPKRRQEEHSTLVQKATEEMRASGLPL